MGKFEVLNLIKELLGGFFPLIRFSIRKGELGNYVTGLKILRCFRGSFWKGSGFWIFSFFLFFFFVGCVFKLMISLENDTDYR